VRPKVPDILITMQVQPVYKELLEWGKQAYCCAITLLLNFVQLRIEKEKEQHDEE